MKKIFIYLSIILHVIVLVLSLFKFGNIFDKTIKDNGYAVFDFVAVGDKSTAPVLSKENGKASKTKSYVDNDKKEEDINKQNDNTKEKTKDNESIKNKSEQKEQEKIQENEKKEAVKEKNNKVTKLPINKDIKKQERKQPNNKQKNKDNKKQTKKTNNSTKKQSNKSDGKALVNLKKNNKASSKSTKKTNKKSFNSFLDNVLADGNNKNTGANAESLGETLTANQIDQIRNTVRKCWHFPAGLKDAETLVVDIKMELDRNGYVKKAEVVDKNRMKRDSGYRIAAENAQRAVLDPSCNPLPLPKEKYKDWKDLELSFNPKDML